MTTSRSAVLLALALAACAPRPDAAPDTTVASTPAALGADPATAAPAPVARAGLVLDGDGLRVIDTATGSMRAVDFGAAADAALATFTALLGAPAMRGTNAECSATPMTTVTWANGLTVRLVEDRFVGWGLASPRAGAVPSAPLTTASGIGIGSTRAALDGAYSAKVARTPLGTEFMTGGLAGLLTGDGPDARVTDLWAGLGCTMR